MSLLVSVWFQVDRSPHHDWYVSATLAVSVEWDIQIDLTSHYLRYFLQVRMEACCQDGMGKQPVLLLMLDLKCELVEVLWFQFYQWDTLKRHNSTGVHTIQERKNHQAATSTTMLRLWRVSRRYSSKWIVVLCKNKNKNWTSRYLERD